MTTSTSDLPQILYVKISDYNRLKEKFEKIRIRNDKLVEKNKELTVLIEDLMKNYRSIEESKKKSDVILMGLQETVKSLMQQIHKPKEEYSTTTSQIEIKSNLHKGSCTSEYKSKLEEMEANYNEMTKNYSNSVIKYKIIKEDYDNLALNNSKLLEQIKIMNDQYNIIVEESNLRLRTIQRCKEVDRNLMDTAFNCFILNLNEDLKMPIKDDKLNSNSNMNLSYFNCEPIPTYLKFLNNSY